jgi:hypothetical protein
LVAVNLVNTTALAPEDRHAGMHSYLDTFPEAQVRKDTLERSGAAGQAEVMDSDRDPSG